MIRRGVARHRAGPEHVLLVGPIASTPWATLAEVKAEMERLGATVTVDHPRTTAGPLGRPRPYHAVSESDATYRRLVADRTLAYVAWARRARRMLRDLSVDHVVAWSGPLAILLRVLRPRGVVVTWVFPREPTFSRREKVLRGVAVLVVDRLAVGRPERVPFGRGRQVHAPVPRRGAPPPETGREWAVLLGAGVPDAAAIGALQEVAMARPAAAVVIDGRRNDAAFEHVAKELQAQIGAPRVVYAFDEHWPAALDVGTAYDPGPFLGDDHRHWSVLDSGGRVLSAAGSYDALQAPLRLDRNGDGPWRPVIGAEAGDLPTLAQWCRAVLAFAPVPERPVIRAVDCCPTCASTEADAVSGPKWPAVLRCRDCGLCYAQEYVAPDALYGEAYHDSAEHGHDYLHPFLREASDGMADLRLRFLARWGVRRGRLLDVGAGLGHFVARATADGWQAEGVELSPIAAKYAKELFDVDLHVGDLESAQVAGEFDVVALCQTLEHFPDPVAALRRAARRLAPGGALFVEVPNVASLARRLQGRNWILWQPGEHVVHFDARTLAAVLERAGLRPTRIESSSLMYDAAPGANAAMHLGLLARHRFEEPSAWSVRLGSLANRKPVRAALFAVARVVDRLGWGQDLVAIATRQ